MAHKILADGGLAIDAVVAAVKVMEDSPMFNAGRGSVLASDGGCYMDASIMDGATGGAGALCGSSSVQNPIEAAYKVMTSTPYVMLVGERLTEFAQSQGLVCQDTEWFKTDYRREQLKEAQINNTIILDHEKAQAGLKRKDNCKGTVGAVALDKHGNLAAATSTGGLCNKDPGRVGDSALIGAGTCKEHYLCCIRYRTWGTLHSLEYSRTSVCNDGVWTDGHSLQPLIGSSLKNCQRTLEAMAVDSHGNVALPFNTGGMFRGWMSEDGQARVQVWKDEQA